MKLVLALQFCHKDAHKAEELADLISDLEPRRRDDVAVLLACTTEDHADAFLDRMRRRCEEKFAVGTCVVGPDTEERRRHWGGVDRWTTGSSIIWKGVVEWLLAHLGPEWTTLFTVDGGDGVPTRRDWADVVMADHARTLAAGGRVTGMVREGTWGRWHVNGNMVAERSFLADRLAQLRIPEDEDGWDGFNADVFLAEARDSSVVQCDWQLVGATADLFARVALESAWWHGSKDKYLVALAREHVARHPGAGIRVVDRGMAARHLAGGNPRQEKNFPRG